ncbi:unnamed protein product, partial [Bubo scandiacus]
PGWWLEGAGDEKKKNGQERESSGIASSSPLLSAVNKEQTLGSSKCWCIWKYSERLAGGRRPPTHPQNSELLVVGTGWGNPPRWAL